MKKKWMKKKLILVLAGSMIFSLAGCKGAVNEASNDTSEIAEVAYASVVEISINPYFRVYLDSNQTVLKVESLNDDAEEVCKKLDANGKNFDIVFGDILEESVNQGYLNDGKTIDVQVVENNSEVYAPDIVQHTMEIAEETIAAHEIEAEVAVAISEEIIEEQAELWDEQDHAAYVENSETKEQQEPSECATCSGTGIILCAACDAHGELVCVECNETGIISRDCDRCEDGLILCDNCNGDYEKVPCDTCGGDGLLNGECRYCKGTGKCVNCNGSGQELNDDGSMGSCHTCDGSGLHTNLFYGVTKACNGDAPCNHCPGTGYVVCNRCYFFDDEYSEHPGYLECEDCQHGVLVEDCPACGGRGIAACGNCEGRGETVCPDCDGKGHQ